MQEITGLNPVTPTRIAKRGDKFFDILFLSMHEDLNSNFILYILYNNKFL